MKVSKVSQFIIFGLILSIPAVGCKKKLGFLTLLPGSRAGQLAEPSSAPLIALGEKTNLS